MITRHNNKGLIWYQYQDLIAFKITELIEQMYTIYGVDYRMYLFSPKTLEYSHIQQN